MGELIFDTQCSGDKIKVLTQLKVPKQNQEVDEFAEPVFERNYLDPTAICTADTGIDCCIFAFSKNNSAMVCPVSVIPLPLPS